jgi:uncharacterized repeat protein (TIGR02543 family)
MMKKCIKRLSVPAVGLLLLTALYLTGCIHDPDNDEKNRLPIDEPLQGGPSPNKSLVSVHVTRTPNKTKYWMYESLNLTGIRVIAAFDDRSTKIIDNGELTDDGFASDTSGVKEVTVTYGGLSDTFNVTVAQGAFTVTFDKNGGNGEASPNIKAVAQPSPGVDSLPTTPPAKTYYDFTEWNTKADGSGDHFTADSLVTGNLTVYAQYKIKSYGVTFNSNGGSGVTTQTITHGEKALEPAKPVINNAYNCKFEGWYTDNTTFNDKWIFTGNTVTSDVALYAKWIPYELGDTGPGGGKIFYRVSKGFTVTVDETSETCYYLEASPKDIDIAEWSSTQAIQITGAEIGAGKQNTKFIAAKLNRLELKSWFAAQICVEYENNGISDWFLPSKDELNQLFINRSYVDGLKIDDYWSSTQYGIRDSAWFQYFDNAEGKQAVGPLRTGKQVRAVRTF